MKKNSDKADENNERTSQNISEKKEEESTEESQKSEYLAEKSDAILAEMGIKSYDIWEYLRPETGKETEEFINKKAEEECFESEDKEECKKRLKRKIHGRYKVEQKEPLVIKVQLIDPNYFFENSKGNKYLSEQTYGDTVYTCMTSNGLAVKNGEKWYEICGYEYNNAADMSILWYNRLVYGVNGESGAEEKVIYSAVGFSERDEPMDYSEEKVKKNILPKMSDRETEYKEGQCTYMCNDLTVHVCYRVYEPTRVQESEEMCPGDVFIGFYAMVDEDKALTCLYETRDITGNYYNEITEEMLREIFTVREYK